MVKLPKKFIEVLEATDRIKKQIDIALAPVEYIKRNMMWTDSLLERFKPVLSVIKKIQDNHEEGKEIRGHIVTSIIDLDEMFDEIILKKYVKDEVQQEFVMNMLSDESCSTGLKMKTVFGTGLLNNYQGLEKDIRSLINIRNTVAHSK